MKKSCHWLLALLLWTSLATAAPQAEDVPEESPVPPPTMTPAELENKTLPPEIREDVERTVPVPSTQPLPGEADADDGTSDPDATASPAAAAPEAETEQPTPAPTPRATKVKSKKPRLPGATPKKPVPAWNRPADPEAADAAKAAKEARAAKAKAAKEERERKRAEREAKRDAEEAERLSRENERKAAAQAKKAAREAERKAKRAKSAKPDANATALAPATGPAGAPPNPLASGSDASMPTPGPSPAPDKGKKSKRKKDKSVGPGASPSPGASPAPDAVPPRGKSEKGEGKSRRRRDTEFKRTGEEAPIPVGPDKRTALAPVAATSPYLEPLKAILASLVDAARNPMERDLALSYMGYVGDKSRVAKMYEKIDDAKVDDGEKLPVIAALVGGHDDRSRLPQLHRIADDPRAAPFQKLWALEILAQAGDRSRIAVAQRLIDDPQTDANDRMRALTVLAQLGDDSRRQVVAKLGHDADLFLATRMQALACLARMELSSKRGGEGMSELRKVMQRSHLSVEERLSIALDLCLLGDATTRDFLERVVEVESDTIFDQLRALHGLALLGVNEHLGLLQETFSTKKRPRNTARRILVMMGDRSRIGDLLDDARAGDLEAVRTLVLAAVLDSGRGSTIDLLRQPRFRALIAPQ